MEFQLIGVPSTAFCSLLVSWHGSYGKLYREITLDFIALSSRVGMMGTYLTSKVDAKIRYLYKNI